MIDYLKLALAILIGLLLGLVIHGLIEIPALWILTNWMENLFFGTSWNVWLWIHLVFTIVVEILGIIIALFVFRKCIQKAETKK